MKTSAPYLDTSRSGVLFNIMKVAVCCGYDKAMALAVAHLWGKQHTTDFHLRQWEAIYNKVHEGP